MMDSGCAGGEGAARGRGGDGAQLLTFHVG
jgi:hypothetical protein